MNKYLIRGIMARMYRETVTTLNKSITLPAQGLFTISPIDADQIPNGYLKTVKVSVNPLQSSDTGLSYLIVANGRILRHPVG